MYNLHLWNHVAEFVLFFHCQRFNIKNSFKGRKELEATIAIQMTREKLDFFMEELNQFVRNCCCSYVCNSVWCGRYFRNYCAVQKLYFHNSVVQKVNAFVYPIQYALRRSCFSNTCSKWSHEGRLYGSRFTFSFSFHGKYHVLWCIRAIWQQNIHQY